MDVCVQLPGGPLTPLAADYVIPMNGVYMASGADEVVWCVSAVGRAADVSVQLPTASSAVRSRHHAADEHSACRVRRSQRCLQNLVWVWSFLRSGMQMKEKNQSKNNSRRAKCKTQLCRRSKASGWP